MRVITADYLKHESRKACVKQSKSLLAELVEIINIHIIENAERGRYDYMFDYLEFNGVHKWNVDDVGKELEKYFRKHKFKVFNDTVGHNMKVDWDDNNEE